MKIGIIFTVILSWNLVFSQEEMISISGTAQGTTYHISYFDPSNKNLKREIDSILLDFDMSVSTYRKNSIISRVNSNDSTVILDEYFITCFHKAKEIWAATNGAFDPTVYPLVNAWGFGPEKKQNVDKSIIDSLQKFVGFEKVEIKEGVIKKLDPRVKLDFNAFAQGYSVDVVARFIESNSIHSYIVEIGGEVFAKGKFPNGNDWIAGIEQPIDNKKDINPHIKGVILDGRAIATSGNYRRFTIVDGQRVVHHIDPKTGYPTQNNLLSASIISNECITSDANATGVLVMGLRKAKRYLRKHHELGAYLIYSDKKGNYITYQTANVKSLLIEL